MIIMLAIAIGVISTIVVAWQLVKLLDEDEPERW